MAESFQRRELVHKIQTYFSFVMLPEGTGAFRCDKNFQQQLIVGTVKLLSCCHLSCKHLSFSLCPVFISIHFTFFFHLFCHFPPLHHAFFFTLSRFVFPLLISFLYLFLSFSLAPSPFYPHTPSPSPSLSFLSLHLSLFLTTH